MSLACWLMFKKKTMIDINFWVNLRREDTQCRVVDPVDLVLGNINKNDVIRFCSSLGVIPECINCDRQLSDLVEFVDRFNIASYAYDRMVGRK